VISTVTTSTVAILSTPAIAGSLAVIGILVLIALLIQKELATASADGRMHRLSRLLNFAILPLMFGFILIVIFKVIEVLN
jgi:hypothetical protein